MKKTIKTLCQAIVFFGVFFVIVGIVGQIEQGDVTFTEGAIKFLKYGIVIAGAGIVSKLLGDAE